MAKFATTLKGLSKNKIVIFIAGMILATIIIHFACGGLHQCAAFRSESYESPEQLEAELNALLQEISKAPELQSMESDEANPDIEVSDDQAADLQALPEAMSEMPVMPEDSDDEGEMMGGSMAPAPISP
tara:strand:+ start:1132 stop:1518 length:387 start_codon:yes stop_codon:yes gene_type:complete